MYTHQVSLEMKIETKASVSKNETPPQEGISQEKNEEKRLPVSENKTPSPCLEEWLFHFPKCGQGVGILFSKMNCKMAPPKKIPFKKSPYKYTRHFLLAIYGGGVNLMWGFCC